MNNFAHVWASNSVKMFQGGIWETYKDIYKDKKILKFENNQGLKKFKSITIALKMHF